MIHRRLVTPQRRPMNWMIDALPWLSAGELGLLAQAAIDRLDEISGDADFEAELDHGCDDEGEDEEA